MKIVTVVGARPQFIKLALLSEALKRAGHIEYAIHTGQHFDYAMSEAFYKELTVNPPDINLGISDQIPTRQLGRMIEEIGRAILDQKAHMVIVFGDTTSTLAGALAANKCDVKLAHVEAGIRSFNKNMPEEANRILTDHISQFLFCPTITATKNLINEGIPTGIFFTGDITYDIFLNYLGKASSSDILQQLNLSPKSYVLVTIHRSYNLVNPYSLKGIMNGFAMAGQEIVFPIHPHTSAVIKSLGSEIPKNIRIIDPVGYADMLSLEKNAKIVATDSGGMQKEAYWFSVPCATLRTETEWPETLFTGWNVLVGSDPLRINAALTDHVWPNTAPLQMFGNGNATKNIVDLINAYT